MSLPRRPPPLPPGATRAPAPAAPSAQLPASAPADPARASRPSFGTAPMPAPPSTAGFTARPPNFVPANAPSAAPPLRPPTVAAPPAPAAAPAPVGAPQPTSSKPDAPIIVVAEDDPEIRVMIVRSLATQFTVYEAPDGQAAFELLERIAPPDCIVSDVMMPRLDGLSLAKRVKGDARLKAVPFIFLTAKNSPLDVVQGINAGARHYLAKPFKVKELLEKVTSVAKAKK